MIPLHNLAAELTTTDYGGGTVLSGVLFDCPAPGCARGHVQLIPYSDAPHHPITVHGTARNVWQRTGGSSVDDLTLAPSIAVPSCGLHGYVRHGQWCPC